MTDMANKENTVVRRTANSLGGSTTGTCFATAAGFLAAFGLDDFALADASVAEPAGAASAGGFSEASELSLRLSGEGDEFMVSRLVWLRTTVNEQHAGRVPQRQKP